MQKIVNVLAVASSVVSLAVVGSGLYLFIQKDAIIKDITEKAMDSALGGLSPAGLGGGVEGFGDSLPLGTNDLPPTSPQAAAPQTQTAIPSGGLGISEF